MWTLAGLLSLLVAQIGPGRPGPDDVTSQALDVLERRCVRCHGEQKSSGQLRLSTRGDALRGGEGGAALVPGRPEESRLWRALSHTDPDLEMPPSEKLPAEEIETLRRWIVAGAPWPSARRLGGGTWWAFRPPARPPVPAGAPHPVDAFVAERLRARGLAPTGPADRPTLIRRATLDLHGLPATAAEVEAFVADTRPDAFERLLDRLLASPRYGEKWGRHFLDVIRYSDSAGFEHDPHHLDAWRFRDYIVASFNEDKPYDRLARELLAGDELWPKDPVARTGTGFLRVGPHRDFLNSNEEVNRIEKLNDLVETTSVAFLGLTVACARCHDHKFDPIPAEDFYRLQAIFEPAVYDAVVLNYEAGKEWDRAQNAREFQLRQVSVRLNALLGAARARLGKGKANAAKPDLEVLRRALTPTEAAALRELERTLVKLYASYTPVPAAAGVTDAGPWAPPSYVALRGNPKTPGARVQPGFLAVLGGGDVPPPPPEAATTGRRKALAEWLTRPDHPLFARVMVNRIWQYHFGRGLLPTANDFGLRAGLPSHPELLDWLAVEFVGRGFSLKAMHRLLMTSAAYQRSAIAPAALVQADPDNVLLARFSRRRLQAEELRDAVLQASGALNPKMGGIPVVPPLDGQELEGIMGRPGGSWPVTPDPAEHLRRSLYLVNLRTFRMPLFEAFDAPDGLVSCPRRHESTTAPQSLALLNSRFMVEQAARLARMAGSVDGVFRAALARGPSPSERQEALRFLADQTRLAGSRVRALGELARALLNTNEFLHVE